MSRLQDVIQRGIRADQPLATAVSVGTLYGVSDENNIVERSTGAAWQAYSPTSPVTTGSFVKLSQIVTAASQSTVDFTSISGSYTTLKVLAISRDTAAGTADSNVNLKVNNDGTSGNYTATSRIGSSNGSAFASTSAASAAGASVGFHPNDGNTAGLAGSLEVTINLYAGTTFQKTILSMTGEQNGTSNGAIASMMAVWKSTAAITRLTFSCGTAFKDGSVFTLYGLL